MLNKIIKTIVLLLFTIMLTQSSAYSAPSTSPRKIVTKTQIAPGLTYIKRIEHKHVIHVLTVDPKFFELKLAKAHNQVFGREVVPVIAKRLGATAAINAGFFEIGGNQDGQPSGTLIIDDQLYALTKRLHSLLLIDDSTVAVAQAHGIVKLTFPKGAPLTNVQVNRFAKKNETILYHHTWGHSSLTPYDRHEILLDRHGKVIGISTHGDNLIPHKGWVLSFAKQTALPPVKTEQTVKIDMYFEDALNKQPQVIHPENAILGIPLLVLNHQLAPNQLNAKKTNHPLPQARTAVGIMPNGKVVLVVVEHRYMQPIRKITMEQVQEILIKHGYSKARMALMTAFEVRAIVERELTQQSNVVGLTLRELAQFMLNLGVKDAINLDGGGSATMVVNNTVVNQTIGDEDEANALVALRPVSDALVIIPRTRSL